MVTYIRKISWVLMMGLTACSLQDPEVQQVALQFEDGFEVSDADLTMLFPNDGSRWTNIQQVGERNEIALSTQTVSEGMHSLRLFAGSTESVLSKMDIEKGGFVAPENAKVRIEADFFIATEVDIENLLLIDLECCSCWDPTVPDNQCPGIRLMIKSNDYLSIERGKILGTTLTQNQVAFPRNEWVKVRWEMVLSPDEDGINTLLINGEEALAITGMNMPNAALFREEAAGLGIDFELQEPVYYERLQIGVTANPTSSDVELFIDDFKLTITE